MTNLFELFKDGENHEGFTLTGGNCLKKNPDFDKEVLEGFKDQIKEKTDLPFMVLYLIRSFDGDGEYAEGSLVAINENHNIISEQEIWRA